MVIGHYEYKNWSTGKISAIKSSKLCHIYVWPLVLTILMTSNIFSQWFDVYVISSGDHSNASERVPMLYKLLSEVKIDDYSYNICTMHGQIDKRKYL